MTYNEQIQNISIALQLLAREAARRNPVEVQQTPGGGYDVVLHLDGTYRDREEAQAVATMFTEALVSNAAPPHIVKYGQLRDADLGPGSGLIDLFAAMHAGTDDEDDDL